MKNISYLILNNRPNPITFKPVLDKPFKKQFNITFISSSLQTNQQYSILNY